mgnify:CR=1 FL=1
MTSRVTINSAGVPRRVALKNPPHFRTGSVPQPPQNPVERAALVALNHARNDRSNRVSAKVAA